MNGGEKVESSGIRGQWYEKEVWAETKKASAYWGRRVGLNANETEDCESKVNIVVFQRIAEGGLTENREGGWEAYVWGVAHFCALGCRRSRGQVADVDPDLMPGSDDPIAAVEGDELLMRLRFSISKLERNKRKVLCDRFFEGKRLKTIASEMGMSIGWVHGKQKEAFDDLRRMVG